MKIVIEIDENVFTRLFDNGTEDNAIVNDDLFAIAKSIHNGTPLPKGCGNLIDVNDLLEQIDLEDTEENREENVGSIVTLEDLDRITPVIRAESEGKE